MALYVGGKKVKVMLDGKLYNLKIMRNTEISTSNMKSSDNYVLKSSDGLVLMSKEEN